ncbi:hypothetical protein B5S27_g3341 [[Candida] boidinii]|nr:hypothetical protein B5S27_g3341 [[Candida] boidinii]
MFSFSSLGKFVAPAVRQNTRNFSFVALNQSAKITQTQSGLTSTSLIASQQATSTVSASLPTSFTTPLSPFLGFLQRRWGRGGFRSGNRGNTYQPNTLKRKRALGFLARIKSRTGRKVLERRKTKGRWFLTY